jgi:hypothetical protein
MRLGKYITKIKRRKLLGEVGLLFRIDKKKMHNQEKKGKKMLVEEGELLGIGFGLNYFKG